MDLQRAAGRDGKTRGHRLAVHGIVLAITFALSGSADGQDLLGGLISRAKREAEARAREAVNRATSQPRSTPGPAVGTPAAAPVDTSGRRDPAAAPSGDTPFSAEATEEEAARITPGYGQYPAYRSFWPAPQPYVPPAQRSQSPTRVPPGTPDTTTGGKVGPQTAQGKAAWIFTPYELKMLTWGDALSPHGSAGLPLYAARNINNSPARQKWITTFDGWVRATYQPMGLLPIPFREIYPEKAKSAYIPVQYGINYRLYQPFVRNGKLDQPPVPPAAWIGIMANALPGTDVAPMVDLPDRSFTFTMAYDADFRITVPKEARGLEAEAAWVRHRIGIDAPVYLTSNTVVVLLTRDGKLPVRQLTIGETLDRAEAGMRRQQTVEPVSDDAYRARLNGLQIMRTRHARELNAPAWAANAQFSIENFYNNDEIYGPGDKGATYPVYTFADATYAAARTDTPQWLVVTFPRYHPKRSWAEFQVFSQMVDHFNYAYARDAIFHPERVAGKPYTPR